MSKFLHHDFGLNTDVDILMDQYGTIFLLMKSEAIILELCTKSDITYRPNKRLSYIILICINADI